MLLDVLKLPFVWQKPSSLKMVELEQYVQRSRKTNWMKIILMSGADSSISWAKWLNLKRGEKNLTSPNTSLMTSEERLLLLFSHPKILKAILTKPSENHSYPNRTSEERERKSNKSSQLKILSITPKPPVSALATTKNLNPNGTQDQVTRNQHYKTTCFAIINLKTSRGK